VARIGCALGAGACLLGIVPAARAEDGVVEINQACATGAGCFPGDAGAFPVSITESGSYRLTSNLRVSSAAGAAPNTDVIQILTDDVTLDLNGFVVSCRRTTIPPAPCSDTTGTGRGIVVNGKNIHIENGTVRDMASSGILAEASATYALDSIRARNNADGLLALQNSNGQIFRSYFAQNTDGLRFDGVAVAMVLDTTTHNNSQDVDPGSSTVAVGHLMTSAGQTPGQGLSVIACVVTAAGLRACP
jgi:hypothetical protein